MDSLMQKKLAEGKQLIADAEKALKTSLFKRKPDLETAADAYSKAGVCFKTAKDFQNSIDCCLKSADCYEKNNAIFSSAKQHEQVGMMANEAKNYQLVYQSFEKAAELMILNGTRDSAGILLERGSNMLKLTDPESSLKLMRKAILVGEVEDKDHLLMTLYENAINLSLRIDKLHETVELIDEVMNVLEKIGSSEQIIKYVLTVCLVYLYKDDWVSAKNYLEKTKQRFALQCRADDLLEMYEEKDDEKFKELIKNYLSYAVDNEALKLANKIIKSKEWLANVESHKVQRVNEPVSKPSEATSNEQPTSQNDDQDEDFEDGLL